jgi:hypothetical protein
MIKRAGYTIIDDRDIGKSTIEVMEKTIMIKDLMGKILPGDVGKMVFLRNGLPYVENDSQRDERIRKKDRECIAKFKVWFWKDHSEIISDLLRERYEIEFNEETQFLYLYKKDR